MRDGEQNDDMIDRVAETLREPVRISPALDARVMAMVRAAAASGPDVIGDAPEGDLLVGAPTPRDTGRVRRSAREESTWRWFTRPRAVPVSPLAGMALAAGIAALVVGVSLAADRATGAAPAPVLAEGPQVDAPMGSPVATSSGPTATFVRPVSGGEPMRVVSFVLVAPEARTVTVAGDFNDWAPEAMPLHQSAGGVWSVALPLAPGRYNYSFVVDGRRWIADPAAPRAVDDDFGVPSSMLVIGDR